MSAAEIRATIDEVARAHGIDATQLDSMTATTLVVALEDRFRVNLPDEELAACHGIDDLAAVVARSLA